MANKGKGKDDEVVYYSWRACNEEAGTFKTGFARVVGEWEFPPFTIADSGNCLLANSIFAVTDCLTVQIGTVLVWLSNQRLSSEC